MYFPIGWPKVLLIPQLGQRSIRQVVCNRDKLLFAILTDDSLWIWYCKPCVPIVSHRRSQECLDDIGTNELVEWRPDSSMLVVATSGGHLLLYKVGVVAEQKSLYVQIDSPHPNLRRDSAELFIKEDIPPLHLTLSEKVGIEGGIKSMVCIRNELMLATTRGHVLRYRWDGSQNRDYCLDLRRVPFCIDQQVSKAIPIVEANTFIVDIEYSPLVGGFAVVFNDGRAAFLTASCLRFDPNQVQGIWAQNIEDATCASVNHKYRLIVFGRKNSQCIVYCIDESTGGLEISHQIVLSSKDYPGSPGGVRCIRWTPDGCAMAIAWEHGGISLWSTFGALLMCTLGWDYGLHADLLHSNPLHIHGMEWSAEGYQLWMVKRQPDHDPGGEGTQHPDCIIQLDFVKSALTVNPCMSHQGHLYLQGEDRLFVNLGNNLTKTYSERPARDRHFPPEEVFADPGTVMAASTLMGSKQWIIVPIPSAYSGTNWPIRYTAIDVEGESLAVAGRTGLAHYSMVTRKWKMFGNETQEKDFVVTGGLLWWHDHVIMGCYSILDNRDEIRIYPRETRLDNAFVKVMRISAQALLLNTLRDSLITYCADGRISIYNLTLKENQTSGSIELSKLQSIDISALCVHPACVVSVTLTALRTESIRHTTKEVESIMLNVSGRLLMAQREQNYRQTNDEHENSLYTCSPPTVLASYVENVWVPRKSRREKPHLTEALWLFCGAHGMRVWLPLFPRDGDKAHTFMSKRIMLPFHLRIYPLAILFEDAILLGAENDTMLYTSDANSPFSLPFSVLEKTSQVYLHQILRQLIRRNLGYHAWEIARSCTSLPYFPHSLELLLHEVLEEEATSKEPIPDAQLPSVIEFIQEFPVYLQTVVQCARKTEIALWPYLFSAAGKPKDLFQECLARKQLDTAASYLIILQNLEPSSVSRQYATLLLDAALEQCKWELSKDLVRFLRAIDPNDVESPRASFIMPSKYGLGAGTPPLSPNEDDLSLVLGTMQVSRGRSFSTTSTPKTVQLDPSHRELAKSQQESSKSVPMRRKKSVPTGRRDSSSDGCASAEEFFIDVILQRHARRLLSAHRLSDLGHFAAHLDFHLVTWLCRERDRVARIDDVVSVLKQLHEDFSWPYPVLQHPVSYYLQRNASGSSPSSPTADDRMKSLAVDIATGGSHVGDSGYVSYPSGHMEVRPGIHLPAHYPPSILMPSEYPSSSVVEAQLMPHLLQDERSIISEECSLWGDDMDHYNMSDTSDSRWSEIPSSQLLEKLSLELSNRGSPKAEVQLRYLLQLFMEANCLEWALIISVLLRDAMAVLRTTNSARSQDQTVESVQRLKDGLLTLCQWSNTECLGYKPFTLAIQNQIGVLNKILSSKQQLQQALLVSQPTPSSPRLSRSRRISSNHETNSQGGSTSATAASSLELAESTNSQDKTASNSRISDDVSLDSSNKPRSNSERREISGPENSDLASIEEAKEQAIEGSGCIVS